MSHYHIGIDFGTSQTKICSTNMEEGVLSKTLIFHKFSQGESYFLPSSIKLDPDGICTFGLDGPNLIRYFKMKALFDENEKYSIDSKKKLINENNLTQQELGRYPEICCILYLAYCILDVKESFDSLTPEVNSIPTKVIESITIKPKQNWFLKLFGKKENEIAKNSEKIIQSIEAGPLNMNEWFYTIGIPTEYDRTEDNYWRRCKQYEMLYLAIKLAKKVHNKSSFKAKGILSLLNIITDSFNEIPQKSRLNQVFYEQEGLFVIAETTAGIIPVRDRLQRVLSEVLDSQQSLQNFRKEYMGNYITMDIGAGTTDVSFFKFYINEEQIKMKYYASKSIDQASNLLILKYLESDNLDDIIKFDNDNIDRELWDQKQIGFRNHLFEIIRLPESNLYDRVNSIFENKPREYWHYEYSIAKGCKVYGGGSRFSEFNYGELMLHNGGRTDYAPKFQTYTQLQKFIIANEFNLALGYPNGKVMQREQQEYQNILCSLDILNVALGLAIVDFKNRPDGNNGWLTVEKLPGDLKPVSEKGMAMYDVFNRDWIGKAEM